MSEFDYVLLGLCLWCVATSYFSIVFYLRGLKLKMLVMGMVETIKDIADGTAEIVTKGGSITIEGKK